MIFQVTSLLIVYPPPWHSKKTLYLSKILKSSFERRVLAPIVSVSLNHYWSLKELCCLFSWCEPLVTSRILIITSDNKVSIAFVVPALFSSYGDNSIINLAFPCNRNGNKKGSWIRSVAGDKGLKRNTISISISVNSERKIKSTLTPWSNGHGVSAQEWLLLLLWGHLSGHDAYIIYIFRIKQHIFSVYLLSLLSFSYSINVCRYLQ